MSLRRFFCLGMCLMLAAQGPLFADLPSAQEVLQAYRNSRDQAVVVMHDKQDQLLIQLKVEIQKLDHQARQQQDLQLQLWTHSTLRELEERGKFWPGLLQEPFERPGPLEDLLQKAGVAWLKIRDNAVEVIKTNRTDTLKELEELQIRLVQQDRIDEAVQTRDIHRKVSASKEDEKRIKALSQQHAKNFQQKYLKAEEKKMVKQAGNGPLPPPGARFPFRADNPAFQSALKAVQVESAGFDAGNTAAVKIGRHPVIHGKRGCLVVAFSNGEFLIKETFDTYAHAAESQRLTEAIKTLPYGTLVVLAVKDDATRRFSGSNQSSLFRLGAVQGIQDLPYRSSYTLIGMKGLKMGEAVEKSAMEKLTFRNEQKSPPQTD